MNYGHNILRSPLISWKIPNIWLTVSFTKWPIKPKKNYKGGNFDGKIMRTVDLAGLKGPIFTEAAE